MCDCGFVTIGMVIGGLLGLVAGLIPIYLAFKIGNFSNQIRILKKASCKRCGSRLENPRSVTCQVCGFSPERNVVIIQVRSKTRGPAMEFQSFRFYWFGTLASVIGFQILAFRGLLIVFFAVAVTLMNRNIVKIGQINHSLESNNNV